MAAVRIKWLSSEDPPDAFPAIDSALTSPNGLLAAGGDLGTERLLYAYRHGVFPWFESGQPILWWSPDPRCVLLPGEFHVSRRLRRSLARSPLRVTHNRAFRQVIESCAEPRGTRSSTWITPAMIDAFDALHREGWAHSVEIWLEHRLTGGIYGLAIGRVFFGESMFNRAGDASKVAMLALCRQLARRSFAALDCQVVSPHLQSLGAQLMPRSLFAALLQNACDPQCSFSDWPQDSYPASSLISR